MPRPDLDLEISPLVTASVLLAARHFALASGICWPGIEDILAATGARPEEAHEIEDMLLDQLAALAVMGSRPALSERRHFWTAARSRPTARSDPWTSTPSAPADRTSTLGPTASNATAVAS